MTPPLSRLSLAVLAATALHTPLAAATTPLARHDDASQGEVALQGGRTDMTFDYSGAKVDTTIDMASLLIRQRLADQVLLGVLGGWTALSQTDNPLAADKPTGYHAGVSLDVDFVVRENWSAYGAVAYTYQHVDDNDGGQSVKLYWNEWRAALGGTVGLGGVRLFGGASYGALDGTQRTGGASDSSTPFEVAAKAGGFLGIDWRVDPDGYIGVEGRTGLDEGWLVYFKHRF
jgi:hypothetical protein